MDKPYVFICFDTEDAINPEADDALLRLAQLYDKAGLPACFFIAGEKARVLRERGRRDVINALKRHEIEYHGNYWFEYPEPALVYGNRDPWDQAVQKGRMFETPGLQDVVEIMGQFPVATCQHQNNHSPATTHAMQQAGVKVWNGGLGAPLDGMGWILGMFMVGRNGRTVSSQGSWSGGFQLDPDHPNRRPRTMDPKRELKEFQEGFDAQLAQEHSHVCILGHPTCWAMAEWWGWYDLALPLRGLDGKDTPSPYPHGRRWTRSVARSKADRDAHFQWTEDAARWLARRTDIRVSTFADVYAAYADSPGVWLPAPQVKTVARRVAKQFDYVTVGKTVLSAADALVVLAQVAAFLLQENRRPEYVQIRRTLGPVEAVMIPKGTVTFPRQSYLTGAQQVIHHVNAHGRLPAAIRAHRVDCGPGELLLALAQVFSGDTLPDQVVVEPTAGVPACVSMPCFERATAASISAPPGYDPVQIHLQGRQQAWSYRPVR